MQNTRWDRGLELHADDRRLVGVTGVLPLRLLAERSGLRAGMSAAMTVAGFDPLYDRGQLLTDVALSLIVGAEAISDVQLMTLLGPVVGAVPSNPTVWRSLGEVTTPQLGKINAQGVRFRRWWWNLLKVSPAGFPWLRVAGQTLTGVTVVDLDATIVFAASEKENAQPTYKGGIGFCPNLATCDNTDDVLAIIPRPGNATSNCSVDNIEALDLAVARIPGAYRRRMLIRLDGAGFSHELLEHIAAGGGVAGRRWEFSVGWSCTETDMDAITQMPPAAWSTGIDQAGNLVADTRVADLTGLLTIDRWKAKIPGLRILVRDEPLHPRYYKRATDREKKLGRRFQLVATNTTSGQPAWLDARHRSHVHVENDVKQAKDLGLRRWPSRSWAVNVAWTQLVAIAANLLACYRLLALPAALRRAAPKLLRTGHLTLPGRLTRGQRKRHLHLPAGLPGSAGVVAAWNAVNALPAPT